MESRYRRHRFPPQIIGRAVWLYHRFTPSFRDIEDLLAERVDRESIFDVQRVQALDARFASDYSAQ
jgi:transposase-like protein